MKLDSFLHTCKKYYVVGSTKDPSGKEVHDICKTYPFSAKFTTTKEKKSSDYRDEHFPKFISIDSSLPDY